VFIGSSRRCTARKDLAPHYGVTFNATNSIADNIRALKDWEVKIGSILKDGTPPEQIARTLTDETAFCAG